MARRSLAALTALTLALACAHQGPRPPVITSSNSPTRDGDAPEGDRSHGGRERGVVEFALTGVTAALSATLITLGAVQLHRGLVIRDHCQTPAGRSDDVCAPLTGDPYVNATVSSALSFVLAVPVAVASGFLARRGLRIQRDYRAWREKNPELARLRLAPWASAQGGGLGLRLRF